MYEQHKPMARARIRDANVTKRLLATDEAKVLLVNMALNWSKVKVLGKNDSALESSREDLTARENIQ
jgi:hypothetical protein